MWKVIALDGELVTWTHDREVAESLCARVWRAAEVQDDGGIVVAVKRDGVVVRVGGETPRVVEVAA